MAILPGVAARPRMMLLAVRLEWMSMATSRLPVWSHTLTVSTPCAGSSPKEKRRVPSKLWTESPEGATHAQMLTGKCHAPQSTPRTAGSRDGCDQPYRLSTGGY